MFSSQRTNMFSTVLLYLFLSGTIATASSRRQQQELRHNTRRKLQITDSIYGTSNTAKVLTLGKDGNSFPSATAGQIVTTSQTSSNNRFVDYFESMTGGTNNMILLKWSADGQLDRITPVRKRSWFRTDESQKLTFANTSSSPYGKVALLLNTDILEWIDWNVLPPVPVLVYTLPDKFIGNSSFTVLPNPYDSYGFNQFCVWRLQKLIGASPTYEEYMQRKNIIVWRGEHHDDMDVSRKKLIELANNVTQDTSSSSLPQWLDVADTLLNKDKKLEMEEMVGTFRYQIDIGGVSGTSWGGTRWKMCLGNFVFKVDTFSKDWWHTEIQPWVHYAPVKADLSNLYELYLWAENHPREAYNIAQAGMNKCLESNKKQKAIDRTIDIIQHQILDVQDMELIKEANEIFDTPEILNRFFVLTDRDEDWNHGYA